MAQIFAQLLHSKQEAVWYYMDWSWEWMSVIWWPSYKHRWSIRNGILALFNYCRGKWIRRWSSVYWYVVEWKVSCSFIVTTN